MTLIAVVASRLGHDPVRHRRIAKLLCAAAGETRLRSGRWLIGRGTAIEPWARRAAKRFDIPVQTLVTADPDGSSDDGDLCHRDRSLARDRAVIAMADRVDGLYVRRGGTLHRAIRQRVDQRPHRPTRIAYWPGQKTAVDEIVASGAMGWYLSDGTSAASDGVRSSEAVVGGSDFLVRPPPGRWLVHCTRARVGGWPGQTDDQYRDELLGGDEDAYWRRTPLDSLCRILDQRRLAGSAIASVRSQPVVCLSARPLDELLAGRTFRSHLSRWDYEPYGVLIRQTAAESSGVRPVIYFSDGDKPSVAPGDRWFHHPRGTTHDWTAEREWRCRGDLDLSDWVKDDVRVFAVDDEISRRRLADCPWPVVWVRPRVAVVRQADVDYVLNRSR